MKKATLKDFFMDSVPSAHSTKKHFKKDWDELGELVDKANPVCGAFNYDMEFRQYLELYTMALNARRTKVIKWYETAKDGDQIVLDLTWNVKVGYEKRLGSDTPRACKQTRIVLVCVKDDGRFFFPIECVSFFPVAEADAPFCYWGERTDRKLSERLDRH